MKLKKSSRRESVTLIFIMVFWACWMTFQLFHHMWWQGAVMGMMVVLGIFLTVKTWTRKTNSQDENTTPHEELQNKL